MAGSQRQSPTWTQLQNRARSCIPRYVAPHFLAFRFLTYPFCLRKLKRMVTVRELARSQGFPDHFVFDTNNNDVVTVRSFIETLLQLVHPTFPGCLAASTNRKRRTVAGGFGDWEGNIYHIVQGMVGCSSSRGGMNNIGQLLRVGSFCIVLSVEHLQGQ
jgi:hypothetical protein